MNTSSSKSKLRDWLIKVFSNSIAKVSNERDREDIIEWLGKAKEVVGSEKSKKSKFIELYKILDAKKSAQIVLNSATESVRNYKQSDLPLAIKLSVPITLLSSPLIGLQGAGIAAFGGAIGLPVLLLIFLGSAGITSIIETCIVNKQSRKYIFAIGALIIHDEILRQCSNSLKNAMVEDAHEARKFDMPSSEAELRNKLYKMDPFDFEKHIMSFFNSAGMLAWATKKSNDLGVDGFARHSEGIIVVQCKRYSPGKLIGAPAVQQFKGVIEENNAFRGYLVTTSGFTEPAQNSANVSTKLILVDIEEIIKWHAQNPNFD